MESYSGFIDEGAVEGHFQDFEKRIKESLERMKQLEAEGKGGKRNGEKRS
jgi:hypothetical protein